MEHGHTRKSSQPRSALERVAWPDLGDQALATLRRNGTVRRFAAGEVLFAVGQPGYDFFLVERGGIDITDPVSNQVVVRIEAGKFAGDIGMLIGQSTFLAGIAADESDVLVVEQERLRSLVRTIPEVGDVVLSAFAARRRLLLEWNQGGLLLVGDEDDPVALRLREFVGRSHIAHRWVDRADKDDLRTVPAEHPLPESGAVAILGRGKILVKPTPRDLAVAMGLDLVADADTTFDLLVVGGGPAGLAAGVYGASEGLSTLVIEDTAIGGQAGTSSRIENYLGFPAGVSGKELAYLAQVQAVKFGARIAAPRRATALTVSRGRFELELDDQSTVRGRSVVLANGVQYRRLPIEGLEAFEGRGVYYAATDLEARFCERSTAIVVGGGNSAGQAAMFLSRYASHTHVLVRGDGLSQTMSSYLSDRLLSDDGITLWTHTEVAALAGDARLQEVEVVNNETGARTAIEARALFLMVGAAPNTAWLGGQLALDTGGFVLTGQAAREDASRYETSVPGVFAVGDIRSGSVKRVASAVGEGSVVVSDVHKVIGDPGSRPQR